MSMCKKDVLVTVLLLRHDCQQLGGKRGSNLDSISKGEIVHHKREGMAEV